MSDNELGFGLTVVLVVASIVLAACLGSLAGLALVLLTRGLWP